MRNVLKKATLAFGITLTAAEVSSQTVVEQSTIIDKSYENILEISQDQDMQHFVRNGYNLTQNPDIKRYLYAMNEAKSGVYNGSLTEKMLMSFCLASNTAGYMNMLLPHISDQDTRVKMLGIRNLAGTTVQAMNTFVFTESGGNSSLCPQVYTAYGVPPARNLR